MKSSSNSEMNVTSNNRQCLPVILGSASVLALSLLVLIFSVACRNSEIVGQWEMTGRDNLTQSEFNDFVARNGLNGIEVLEDGRLLMRERLGTGSERTTHVNRWEIINGRLYVNGNFREHSLSRNTLTIRWDNGVTTYRRR
ncbi:MAG: hypothetical protein FWC95_03190 [Defluviitaleaceae bacterium]|nr:hypothetical protein [Defluviitaleaceae bacterium]